MGKWKAVKPGKNRPFELYDLSGDIEEKTDVASEQAEILSKMKGYAEQAHAENIPGGWIDQEKGFKGHQLP
jgi:predicted transcriptional regulator